ncbi:MAG: hypothetical protein ACPGVC_07620, partial [Salibacteraceae bacterium]
VVNSLEEINPTHSIYKYYDSDSQIKYLVANTETELHLSLKTNHKPTIAKILRAGLTIYFDKNGKKGKSVFVNYPIGTPEGYTTLKPNSGQRNQPPEDLHSLINSTSVGAEYSYNKVNTPFIISKPESEIQLALSTNEAQELVYDIVIPFTKISPNGKQDLQQLSIGIVTGKFDMPSQPPSAGQHGGGQRGQGGGGQRNPQQGSISRDASYSGGRKGGRSGGAPHEGFSEMSEECKIWFQVGLFLY